MDLLENAIIEADVQQYLDAATRLWRERQQKNLPPTNIIMFDDFGIDSDGGLGLNTLARWDEMREGLWRAEGMGLCKLRAIIANYPPQDLRARHGLMHLLHAGLWHVPAAAGSDATDRAPFIDTDSELADFGPAVMRNMVAPAEMISTSGSDLLRETLESMWVSEQKVTILCTTSYRDLARFIQNESDATLLKNTVNRVVMMGGQINDNGRIRPDPKPTNNHYSLSEAEEWYSFIQENSIDSTTHHSSAASACAVPRSVFEKLSEIPGPTAEYFLARHSASSQKLWQRSCNPETRVRADVDGAFVLRQLTNVDEAEYSKWIAAEVELSKEGKHKSLRHVLKEQPIWDLLASLEAIDPKFLEYLDIRRSKADEEAARSKAKDEWLRTRPDPSCPEPVTLTSQSHEDGRHDSVDEHSINGDRATSILSAVMLESLWANATESWSG